MAARPPRLLFLLLFGVYLCDTSLMSRYASSEQPDFTRKLDGTENLYGQLPASDYASVSARALQTSSNADDQHSAFNHTNNSLSDNVMNLMLTDAVDSNPSLGPDVANGNSIFEGDMNSTLDAEAMEAMESPSVGPSVWMELASSGPNYIESGDNTSNASHTTSIVIPEEEPSPDRFKALAILTGICCIGGVGGGFTMLLYRACCSYTLRKSMRSQRSVAPCTIMVTPAKPQAELRRPGVHVSAEDARLPSYWRFKRLVPGARSLEQVSDATSATLQNMLDSTFELKVLNDKQRQDSIKGLGIPCRLLLQYALRVEDCDAWKRFATERCYVSQKRAAGVCPPIGAALGGVVRTIDGGVDVGAGLRAGVNEVFLFFGTSPSTGRIIASTGFTTSPLPSTNSPDARLGTEGNPLRHAAAAYATADPKPSDLNAFSRQPDYNSCADGRFAQPPALWLTEWCLEADALSAEDDKGDDAGQRCLVLCRVVLGEAFHLSADHWENGHDAVARMTTEAVVGGLYDSVLDTSKQGCSMLNSGGTAYVRQFAVFDGARAYPEFLLFYTREYYN